MCTKDNKAPILQQKLLDRGFAFYEHYAFWAK